MHIHLEKNLPHQDKAIEAILNFIESKPTNLKNMDIKMETGTGKTYCYTRLMFELNMLYKYNKFIIVVPNLAIKEGTKNFIRSEYSKQHFNELFPHKRIELCIINAGDFEGKNGKRKVFPAALKTFVEGTQVSKNIIYCLLVNAAMVTGKSMSRNNYDITLFDSISCPNEAIRHINPILIIDEPHRFNRDGTTYKALQSYEPKLTFRFGATFPEKKEGKGKKAKKVKDYENLVYDLNAVDSFNQNLVKGVEIEYPESSNPQTERYKLMNVTKEEAEFKQVNTDKRWIIKSGESLNTMNINFGGIEIECDSKSIYLSNDLEIGKGEEIIADVFNKSYQKLMLTQAIERHFEKERENFFRSGNVPKIKTLTLFFIDSVKSYRDDDKSTKGNGWLRRRFEYILEKKLHILISEYSNKTGQREKEYLDFLRASLKDINATNGGYFAEDNNLKGEEGIAKEVDDILRNKEKMLTFKDENGEWNTRRFLFSKWALKEGWDNPNIFVICKLRSSGSEISKLQEVGRGLRLPVDEYGNRLSNEQFYLNYIIDFSEREFAQKLELQVNIENGKLENGKITSDILQKLVEAKYAQSIAIAKAQLLLNGIIDVSDSVIKMDELTKILPDISVGKNKIRTKGIESNRIKLRKDNFDKIRDFWKEISKRYMLEFKDISNADMNLFLDKVFVKEKFVEMTYSTKKQQSSIVNGQMEMKDVSNPIWNVTNDYGIISFKDFVKNLHQATNLSVLEIIERTKNILIGDKNAKQKINVHSLGNLIKTFAEEFESMFATKYDYIPLSFSAETSVIKDQYAVDYNDFFEDDIKQGNIGNVKVDNINVPSNYLYDEIYVDSKIERDVVEVNDMNKILVFGKLPKRSIQVPTYTGGTTSPDFVYAIQDKDNKITKLKLLVETKSEDLRMSEQRAISAQKKFFDKLTNVEWELVKSKTEIVRILSQI